MPSYNKDKLSNRPLTIKTLLSVVADHPNYKAFKVGKNLAIHRIPDNRKHKTKRPDGPATYTIKNGAWLKETSNALFNGNQRKQITHHLAELLPELTK